MKPYYEEPGITIYHGDCRDILPQLEPVDLVLTDPPYGVAFLSARPKERLERNTPIVGDDSDDLLWFFKAVAPLGKWLVAFTRWDKWPLHSAQAAEAGWSVKNMLVWDKDNWTCGDLNGNLGYQHELAILASIGDPHLSGSRCGNVFRCPRVASEVHPAEKPIMLLQGIASRFGSGVILDPFVGVGSTLLAAKNLGRSAIGIEIEERYCEIAVKRLAQGVLAL